MSKGRRRRLSKVSNVSLRRRCSTCEKWAMIPYEGQISSQLPDDEVMCQDCRKIFDTTDSGVTPIHEERETVLYIQWPKRLRRTHKGTEVTDEEIVLIPAVDDPKPVLGVTEVLGEDLAFSGV